MMKNEKKGWRGGVILSFILILTYQPCQIIQLEALAAADGESLVVVLPWGKEEQLTSGTCVHALASWFGEVGEAVFLKDDEGELFVEGGAHDGFLAWGDGGGDEHGSCTGLGEEIGGLGGDLLWREAAGTLHLQAHGAVEEETVAYGGELLPCHHEVSLHTEEVGALAFHEQAARVVAEVVKPALELPLAKKELVVVAWGEKEAVGGMGVSGSGWLRLRLLELGW